MTHVIVESRIKMNQVSLCKFQDSFDYGQMQSGNVDLSKSSLSISFNAMTTNCTYSVGLQFVCQISFLTPRRDVYADGKRARCLVFWLSAQASRGSTAQVFSCAPCTSTPQRSVLAQESPRDRGAVGILLEGEQTEYASDALGVHSRCVAA